MAITAEITKSLENEFSTKINEQIQQRESQLLALCDAEVMTGDTKRVWDIGGSEMKDANGSRVKLSSLESDMDLKNRTLTWSRYGDVKPIDLNQLSMSELKDSYMAKVINAVQYGAARKIDEVLYNSLDATVNEIIYTNGTSAVTSYTFANDGCTTTDFTATGDNAFTYADFVTMLDSFYSKGYNEGVAFLCTEAERSILKNVAQVGSNDYSNSAGAVFDSAGRLTALNGVKIIALPSAPRVGNTIVKNTKLSTSTKRACFMFNTNEMGRESALSYAIAPLTTEIIKANDELKVNKAVFDMKIGAVRKANAYIYRAYTATL